METLVSPDPELALADALVAVSLDASADEAELLLSDFLSPDEHPDNPAMTIAKPPTATTNPRFTTVLLCVVATRQDRRIIPSSMVRATHPDTRLGENVRCANSGSRSLTGHLDREGPGFAEAGAVGVEAVGGAADVVGTAGHRDLRRVAETGAVAAGESAEVADGDRFGGELVFVGHHRGDTRGLIAGRDGGERAGRGALHGLGGARILTVDGHLSGACDERARRRLVLRRAGRATRQRQRGRGRGEQANSHSAESTAWASPFSALTRNCPADVVAPA